MSFLIFGWIGMAITLIAFGLVNFKRYEDSFFPLNVLAAIFLITYEISISAWPVFVLHSFILVTSAIKSYKIFGGKKK